MIVKNRLFKFVDNGDTEELDHNYFVAIRSSYLTLRQGDKFIIEPYSPHRFGRQFGYFQDVPGTLKYDTCAASLEEGLCYWRLCILSKSSSKAWLPGLPTNAKKLCSEAYKAWWAKVHGTFLEDNIACLISPRLPKIILKRKKQGDNQFDSGENNPSPLPIHLLWSSLTLKPKLWKKEKGFHITWWIVIAATRIVEESLNTLFVKVRAYDEARSLSSHKLSRSLHAQHLKEAEDRLQDVEAKASEGASKAQSIMDELEHIEKEIVALKGRRTSLCTALKGQKQLNHKVQPKVNEVKENVAALKNTAPHDDAIVEDLETSKANIEDLKEDLNSLNPFV
ncbi:UNVERIFIED_CONTAM: hypothetical protein Sradi_5747600 [Sesamum radiatum]|uniref:Aminotransferase-like plant mobile domain-containing protein n=1 Tax=Sesamum radiatum TaxID=300843 RepID=A0AAW2L478_SESRA